MEIAENYSHQFYEFYLLLFYSSGDESNLNNEMLAQLYDFKFPKPLEAYLEKPKPPEKRTLKNDGPLACHLCPRKFRVEYSLRQHCISQHSSHYLCSHCNVCFAIDDVQGFKFHMFRHELIGKIFLTFVFLNVLFSDVRWRG